MRCSKLLSKLLVFALLLDEVEQLLLLLLQANRLVGGDGRTGLSDLKLVRRVKS